MSDQECSIASEVVTGVDDTNVSDRLIVDHLVVWKGKPSGGQERNEDL